MSSGTPSPTGAPAADDPTGPHGGALVGPGDVLAHRYRLVDPVPGPAGALASVWRAEDEVLARSVAVKAFPGRHAVTDDVLDAAARAGAADARALPRTYDAARELRPERSSVAYVDHRVGRRHPAGRGAVGRTAAAARRRRARDRGRRGPGPAARRRRGARPGPPGQRAARRRGGLRLTDAEVAAALADEPPAAPEDDVRDLAAVLYAMLTARWPERATAQPGRGLRPAPTSEQGLSAPRQVRAGVPRALDGVVVRALHPERMSGQGPLRTAGALRDALEGAARDLPREPAPGSAVLAPERGPGRRAAPYAVVLALLVVLGITGYSLGLSVGEVPPVDEGLPAVPPASAPASPGAPGAPGPVDLTTVSVRDYDPYGSPPSEKPDQVVNAFDGEPSTAWSTDLYTTDRFGGLKPGVGLLVDLGAPTPLSEVQVDLTTAGAALELRVGDTVGGDEGSLPVVASDDGAGRGVVRLAVPEGTAGRYCLLWITRLPPDGGQYRAGIDELRLVRR